MGTAAMQKSRSFDVKQFACIMGRKYGNLERQQEQISLCYGHVHHTRKLSQGAVPDTNVPSVGDSIFKGNGHGTACKGGEIMTGAAAVKSLHHGQREPDYTLSSRRWWSRRPACSFREILNCEHMRVRRMKPNILGMMRQVQILHQFIHHRWWDRTNTMP